MNAAGKILILALPILTFSTSALWSAPPIKKTFKPIVRTAKPASTVKLQRLDPHGTVDMDFSPQNRCKVCHILKKDGGFEKKPNIEELCFNCHGRLPHSGVLEHMGDGKEDGAGLTCLSCHRPHRAKLDGNAPLPQKSSPLVKMQLQTLPAELLDRPNRGKSGAMLDHPCTECHNW